MDSDGVKITAILSTCVLVALISMFTLLYTINANNVQVATVCVQGGGDWTLVSKKTDIGYRIERGCTHETGQ